MGPFRCIVDRVDELLWQFVVLVLFRLQYVSRAVQAHTKHSLSKAKVDSSQQVCAKGLSTHCCFIITIFFT